MDLPWPSASGRMMKYFFASSGWPSPNSSPAKSGVSMLAPDPPVPCSTTTGSPDGSPIGPVVQAHFRQDVAGMEPEVLGDEGAFLRRRIFGRTARRRRRQATAPLRRRRASTISGPAWGVLPHFFMMRGLAWQCSVPHGIIIAACAGSCTRRAHDHVIGPGRRFGTVSRACGKSRRPAGSARAGAIWG